MSAFRVHKSKIKLKAAILEALADIVAKRRHISIEQALEIVHDKVEVHHEPSALFGYQGDIRDEKAEIICRRDFVKNYLGGGASNDAGFTLRDGCFEAIISDYDNGRWWANAAPRFWQVALAQESILEAKSEGYILHKVEENNEIKLTATMVAGGGSTSHGGAW